MGGRGAPMIQRLSDRTLQWGCASHNSGSSWLTEKNLPSILESVFFPFSASPEPELKAACGMSSHESSRAS